MKAYVQGTLKIVESPEPFNDSAGKPVIYFINHIKTEDGELLVVNSKDSYEHVEGKEGVFALRVRNVEDAFRRDGGSYRGLTKLALAGFAENEVLPVID